jgi:hypothetical protein
MPRVSKASLESVRLDLLPSAPMEVPLSSCGARSIRPNLVMVVLRLTGIEPTALTAVQSKIAQIETYAGDMQWHDSGQLIANVQRKNHQSEVQAATEFLDVLLTHLRVRFRTAGAKTEEAQIQNAGQTRSKDGRTRQPKPGQRYGRALARR